MTSKAALDPRVAAVAARAPLAHVAVRAERVIEMEAFWRFMDRTGGSLRPGSFARK